MKLDFKQLMWDKGLTQAKLAEIMGVQQTVISRFLNNKREPLAHHISALEEYYGKEVIASYVLPSVPFTPHTQEATVTIYDPEMVEELKEELIEEVRAEEIKKTIVLPPSVIRDPKIDIKKEINAGNLDEYAKPTQDILPLHQGKVYTYCDDMEPEIRAGEAVLVRLLPSGIAVVPGEMYFVDMPSGGKIRYVEKEEGGKLYLKARNNAYGDIVVDRSEVQSLASVVMILRTPRSMTNRESTLSEMIERKDGHLSDMLASNNKLIDELCKRNERTDKMMDELLKK